MLGIDERTLIAMYAGQDRQETLLRMKAAPGELMEPGIRETFFRALQAVEKMSDEEYLAVELKDVLLADDDMDGVEVIL